MRIGIDARELLGRRTGVGRYLAELCAEWRQQSATGPHQFILYAPAAGQTPSVLGPPFTHSSPGPFHYRAVPGRGGSWWEQIDLAAAINLDPPDVFFAPAYSAPLRIRVPVVLTVHDISFEAHPEWFSWREGLRRRWVTRQTVRRATDIIAVSGFTRDELVAHLGVQPARISVVWSGIHRPPERHDDRVREPLVLFVGSIFNRRHLPELIQAFAQIAATNPAARLVLVGDNRSHPPQDPARLAARAGVADQVDVRAYVDETELAELYARARVFVFLSEYEGFGLPPLEAMAAGVPTLVGDTPVARELYANGARCVAVHDVQAIATAITTLLNDAEARTSLAAAAAARLPLFTWTRAAADTLAVLERAGHGR
jgi:glycosyltransferase involved in cell wall biosynthesis